MSEENKKSLDWIRSEPTEVFKHLPEHHKVLHVGGHFGREAIYYNDVLFVEPIPKYAEYLRKKGYSVIEGAIAGNEIYLTTYEQASSLLKPKEHQIKDRLKVKSYSLKDIEEGYDLLVLDIQGAELMALKTSNLHFNYIIVEASSNPRYENATTKKEIEKYLKCKGFIKMSEYQHSNYDIYDIIFKNARIQKTRSS